MKSREEFLRDISVKEQIKEFLSFFNEINDENIQQYMESSMLSKLNFISYLDSIKNYALSNVNNPVYGYLLNDYVKVVDEIIKRIS